MSLTDRAPALPPSGPDERSRLFSIVCLSPQEWATPLPTNRQQIMRRAARRGHSVLFVETGEFLGRHLLRLLKGPDRQSLRRRLLWGEHVAPRITVRKALNVLPWGQRFALCDRVNGRVSRAVLRRASGQLPAPRVTWLYDPRATWGIGQLGDVFGVYDCVDDYAEQASGMRNRALVAAADRRAAASARLVFTTTAALRARHLPTNPRTHHIGNAADFEHFAPAADRDLAAPWVAALERPILGFVGNITATKVDLPLLDALAHADPTWTILIAGPAEPSLVEGVRAFADRDNAIWIGPVPYEELPSIVAGFDVALIPYVENAYTRNVFPLKLYEYLAAGKPVVATGLPELAGLEPDVVVANGIDEVEAAVVEALRRTESGDVERRQRLAGANTWDVRTERLLALITAELLS